MNVKAAITLLLGLVFQMAQVLPAAVANSPCTSHGLSCACCEAPDSCSCAKSGEPEQKPAPLSQDTGSVLKLPAAKAGDTRISIESNGSIHPSSATAAFPVEGLPCGYAGVRLSVAFCSFLM